MLDEAPLETVSEKLSFRYEEKTQKRRNGIYENFFRNYFRKIILQVRRKATEEETIFTGTLFQKFFRRNRISNTKVKKKTEGETVCVEILLETVSKKLFR